MFLLTFRECIDLLVVSHLYKGVDLHAYLIYWRSWVFDKWTKGSPLKQGARHCEASEPVIGRDSDTLMHNESDLIWLAIFPDDLKIQWGQHIKAISLYMCVRVCPDVGLLST